MNSFPIANGEHDIRRCVLRQSRGRGPKNFPGGLGPQTPFLFCLPHFIYPRHAAALHSDGTSKKGRSFITYDIVKDDGECLMTGPREIAIGDSGTQLKV